MCSEVLEADPENAATLKDRAEAYIQDEQYEEGRRSSGSPTPPPPTFSEVVNTRDPIETLTSQSASKTEIAVLGF